MSTGRRRYAAKALLGATLAGCTSDYADFGVDVGSASASSGLGATSGPSSVTSGGATTGAATTSGATSAATGGSTSSGGAGGTGGTGAGGAGGIGGASMSASSAASSTASSSSSSGGGGSGGMPTTCGNGALDPNENCDDANDASGDGCSSMCAVEGNPNVCPTQTTITAGPIWIADSTIGKASVTDTSGCGGDPAGDLVYKIVAWKTGTITATLTGGWSKILALRAGCMPSSGYCSIGFQTLSLQRSVTQGEVAHVVVSGGNGDEGPFELLIELD